MFGDNDFNVFRCSVGTTPTVTHSPITRSIAMFKASVQFVRTQSGRMGRSIAGYGRVRGHSLIQLFRNGVCFAQKEMGGRWDEHQAMDEFRKNPGSFKPCNGMTPDNMRKYAEMV